jgi:hypothetical protein
MGQNPVEPSTDQPTADESVGRLFLRGTSTGQQQCLAGFLTEYSPSPLRRQCFLLSEEITKLFRM